MELYLTHKQLEHRLGVSPMTIYLWRMGSVSPKRKHKTEGIPVIIKAQGRGQHNQVLFPYSLVELWIEKYRPALLDNLRNNVCECKLCVRAGKKAAISAGAPAGTPLAQTA